MKTKSQDSNPILDPIETLKGRIFIGGMPLGILTMLLVWGIGLAQHDLAALNVYALPCMALAFLVLGVLLWRHWIPLKLFETILYSLIVAFTLCQYVSIAISLPTQGNAFQPSLTIWLPFIYILGFLILDTNRALLISSIFFGITVILGVAYIFYSSITHLFDPSTSLIVQVFFSNLFFIAVLYLVSRIKERYVTERAVADNMSKLAMTDQLTQVYNRFLLNRLLREEISRAERSKAPLSLMLFDLDHFKRINDTRGHNLGDTVLREAAQLLRQHIRTSDPFGRWGGDEFLCLATNTNPEQAIELAERLRNALQKHHFSENCKVTASFGITSYQTGDSPESLVRRADLGLYKAKADGRNRVEAVLAGVTLPLFEGERPYPIIEDDTEAEEVD